MAGAKVSVLIVSAFVISPIVICQQRSSVVPLQPVQPKFAEVTSALGVRFEYSPRTHPGRSDRNDGSGVALFDYDNDGRLDILSSMEESLLRTGKERFPKTGPKIGIGSTIKSAMGLLKT